MSRIIGLVLLVLAVCPQFVFALDTYFASPRAMGMGGANVASVHDTSAQYYNPAAFGFMGDPAAGEKAADKFGIDLTAAAGYRLHSDFSQYIDDLNDIDLDQLKVGIENESDLHDLLLLTEALNAVEEDKTGVTADATVGIGVRAGRFCIGVRSYAAASGRVTSVDTLNLGFTVTQDELNTDIETVVLSGDDGQVTLLNADQQAALLAAGYTSEAIQNIDYAARQQGISSSDVDGVVNLLVDVADATGSTTSTTLDDNTTTVDLHGISIVELPLSYGYRLTPHIAIGGNLKLMRGRVYKNQVSVFDNNAGDALSETDEHYQETTTFGVDLGVMAKYGQFSFGLVGRNLNSPKFDGFSKTVLLDNGETVTLRAADVRLDPQVTAGVAYMPLETLTIEANIDLVENETTFPGYDTRNISVGLEWDAFHVLALRLGGYKNLANSDVDFVYTAGLGVNLWAARLDIAGAFAADSYEYDGSDIPQEAKISAALSFNF